MRPLRWWRAVHDGCWQLTGLHTPACMLKCGLCPLFPYLRLVKWRGDHPPPPSGSAGHACHHPPEIIKPPQQPPLCRVPTPHALAAGAVTAFQLHHVPTGQQRAGCATVDLEGHKGYRQRTTAAAAVTADQVCTPAGTTQGRQPDAQSRLAHMDMACACKQTARPQNCWCGGCHLSSDIELAPSGGDQHHEV